MTVPKFYAFARQYEERTVLVILNGTSTPKTADLTRFKKIMMCPKAYEVLSQ